MFDRIKAVAVVVWSSGLVLALWRQGGSASAIFFWDNSTEKQCYCKHQYLGPKGRSLNNNEMTGSYKRSYIWLPILLIHSPNPSSHRVKECIGPSARDRVERASGKIRIFSSFYHVSQGNFINQTFFNDGQVEIKLETIQRNQFKRFF